MSQRTLPYFSLLFSQIKTLYKLLFIPHCAVRQSFLWFTLIIDWLCAVKSSLTPNKSLRSHTHSSFITVYYLAYIYMLIYKSEHISLLLLLFYLYLVWNIHSDLQFVVPHNNCFIQEVGLRDNNQPKSPIVCFEGWK